jgi:hypothetical protein
MSQTLAPTDFRPLARFRRTKKATKRLAAGRPRAVPDAPLWARRASLEQIDRCLRRWSRCGQ